MLLCAKYKHTLAVLIPSESFCSTGCQRNFRWVENTFSISYIEHTVYYKHTFHHATQYVKFEAVLASIKNFSMSFLLLVYADTFSSLCCSHFKFFLFFSFFQRKTSCYTTLCSYMYEVNRKAGAMNFKHVFARMCLMYSCRTSSHRECVCIQLVELSKQ